MKRKRYIIICALLLLASCSTYYTYSGSPVYTGQGGACKTIGGIDLWVIGTPPRQYRIVGYISDTRAGGPIPMAMRDSQLAGLTKARGGDGLLLSSDNEQVMGSMSTANAWGTASQYGNVANFNGGAFGMTAPILRRQAKYYVIKYIN